MFNFIKNALTKEQENYKPVEIDYNAEEFDLRLLVDTITDESDADPLPKPNASKITI